MTRYLILSTVTNDSFGKGISQIIYIFILCIVVFVGAYYTSRLLGNYQLNNKKLSNLKILEVISVGPQKTIQLIKVGNEFILVGVTKDKITFLKEVSEANIDLSLTTTNVNQSVPFKKYLENSFKKKSSNDHKDE